MLTIIATPIGNLADISKRALQALSTSDAILCEDTRRSSILLSHYEIKKPLISYHKFTEQKALSEILSALETGKNLALISDAGTPCINDPGQILVQACLEKGIPVTAIPGPCSLIQALVMSGFATSKFQFVGFLPRKAKSELKQILAYPGTSVAFESPERLVASLEAIQELDGARRVAVVREMTKVFEECKRGNVGDVLAHFQKQEPRGELVLVIDQGKIEEEHFSLEELIQMLQDLHGLSLKEAIKSAAKLKGLPKRQVYNASLKTK